MTPLRPTWLLPVLVACAQPQRPAPAAPAANAPSPAHPVAAPPRTALPPSVRESTAGEDRHLADVRQLTVDGPFNAEPRFSPDGKRVVFSTREDPGGPLRVAVVDVDGRNLRVVSPSAGFAACPSFAPDRPRILFASTHAAPDGRREDPASLDLFEMDLDGGNIAPVLASPGLDSEASFSPDGASIVFTSARSGRDEIFVLQRSTGAVRRLAAGGGGVFSPDGARVVFRAFDAGGSVSELYAVTVDGAAPRALTSLGVTSWSPAFHPSGRTVVFASGLRRHVRANGPNFDLYALDVEGGRIERVTYEEGPDGLPSFSPDGATLAWTSARQGGRHQLFLARWME